MDYGPHTTVVRLKPDFRTTRKRFVRGVNETSDFHVIIHDNRRMSIAIAHIIFDCQHGLVFTVFGVRLNDVLIDVNDCFHADFPKNLTLASVSWAVVIVP